MRIIIRILILKKLQHNSSFFYEQLILSFFFFFDEQLILSIIYNMCVCIYNMCFYVHPQLYKDMYVSNKFSPWNQIPILYFCVCAVECVYIVFL